MCMIEYKRKLDRNTHVELFIFETFGDLFQYACRNLQIIHLIKNQLHELKEMVG